MEIQVRGTGEGALTVSDAVFSAAVREPLIHQAVVAYMSNARQGTKAQKSRADVSGGGKKPWRQKHTGRARAGSSRSPIWRHGGVTFAARPRDHGVKLNKKMYRGAMRSIFSGLVSSGALVAIETLEVSEFSTRKALEILKGYDLQRDVLLVVPELTEETYYSFRNLKGVEMIDVASLSPWILLRYPTVACTRAAVEMINERYGV